jgi:cytoskeletal protein CcmA (bactofilin family)
MRKKKHRFPPYASVIGKGTDVLGDIRFVGGLHVDGRVVGDVIAAQPEGCAVSLGASGVVEGNLDVPHALLDGTVAGDVRAHLSAELAPGARVGGALYYGSLEMDKGAEVKGGLVPIEEARAEQGGPEESQQASVQGEEEAIGAEADAQSDDARGGNT